MPWLNSDPPVSCCRLIKYRLYATEANTGLYCMSGPATYGTLRVTIGNIIFCHYRPCVGSVNSP